MAYNKIVLFGETKLDLTADTVTPADVKSGVTFHNNEGEPQVGTLTADVDTSDANALPAEILLGKTAYVAGEKRTGTMPNRGGVTGVISDLTTPYSIPAGFHDGSGTVSVNATEAAKIEPGNIKSGVTILGVTGTFDGGSGVVSQTKTVTPSSTTQNILPDTGYDYLSEVIVNSIPYTEVPNATGTTLSIG